MYPLLVATKSQSPSRRQAAQAVLEMLRTHSATLVDQAQVRAGEVMTLRGGGRQRECMRFTDCLWVWGKLVHTHCASRWKLGCQTLLQHGKAATDTADFSFNYQ
jgi:hypothetical protein